MVFRTQKRQRIEGKGAHLVEFLCSFGGVFAGEEGDKGGAAWIFRRRDRDGKSDGKGERKKEEGFSGLGASEKGETRGVGVAGCWSRGEVLFRRV